MGMEQHEPDLRLSDFSSLSPDFWRKQKQELDGLQASIESPASLKGDVFELDETLLTAGLPDIDQPYAYIPSHKHTELV